jgi:hypothetical protein
LGEQIPTEIEIGNPYPNPCTRGGTIMVPVHTYYGANIKLSIRNILGEEISPPWEYHPEVDDREFDLPLNLALEGPVLLYFITSNGTVLKKVVITDN